MKEEYIKKLEEIIEKQEKIIEEYQKVILDMRGLFQGTEPENYKLMEKENEL